MKVFIATDLEGVGGVLLDEQVTGDSPEYQRARHLLSQEVNAAVEGARAGGATDILVDDGHFQGFNLIYEELHPGARYVQGRPRPEWLQGLVEGFAATFFIGCHARAGTQEAVRDHTMSSATWHNLWVNDKLTGEIGLWAAIAGHFRVPCVLVSGCARACEEARALVPQIEAVVTKTAVSRTSAVLEPVDTVRREIRLRAEAAVENASAVPPLDVESPVELKVEYNQTGQADAVPLIAGRERIDARTIVYRAATVVEALRLVG
ncbi:MAG: M55 family metallopeptidase [Armatimonadetes bacterium]|nr:M55 family metallopeptidase [Armatimonadota bacterium]